jgi:hypothetical protein
VNAPKQPGLPAKGQFLVYQTEDGQVKIDVRLQGETAWLTQAHMAELFQTTIPNVSMHLRNIYAEGELQPEATIQEFLIVRPEGSRQVSRSVEHYNLDAIISVGYRVKSAADIATRVSANPDCEATLRNSRAAKDNWSANSSLKFHEYYDDPRDTTAASTSSSPTRNSTCTTQAVASCAASNGKPIIQLYACESDSNL